MAVKSYIPHLSRTILLSGLLVVLFGACARIEDLPADPTGGLSPEGRQLVPVTLNLSVAPIENDSSATKAYNDHEPDVDGLSDPSADRKSEIKTILVLQFEQKTGSTESYRIGNQQYFDHYPLTDDEHVSLVASESTTVNNTIYVIANTFGLIPLDGDISLSEFKAKQGFNRLASLSDLTGNGIWRSPNPTAAIPDRYLRMSASVELQKIELGTPVGTNANPLELERNCAKVVVKVKNASGGAVTIDQVQLRDINRKYYYVTNYTSFTDPWSDQTPDRFDEAPQAFPGGDDYTTYTYYTPVNIRGSVTNAAESSKNLYAPRGATNFCIYAHYTEGTETKHVTYTYYLGANLTNDFNLEPNKKYSYTIDITGIGNPSVDSRVEHMDDITFVVDANCYMLKTPTGENQTRTYRIPVRRAAVFWNPVGTNMGAYGAGPADALVDDLTEGTDWVAWLVWNEITDESGAAVPDNEVLIGSSGTGFNPTSPNSSPYLKVKVESGMKGNALVAIKKTGSSDAATLWSWHLWVTDYDPYVEMTPKSGTYVYAVPGGEIHRYVGSYWTSAEYANAFIMDRNLGAIAAIPKDGDPEQVSYGFFYQWGRKDPFFNTGAVDEVAANGTGQQNKQNIRYSVHYPTKFISNSGNNWTTYETSGSVLGAELYTWNEVRFTHVGDYCEADKSIYDPCPYGWRVSKDGIWSDFKTTTTEWSTQHPGLYYYPEGYDVSVSKGRVYYPATGVRYSGSGGLQDAGIAAYSWWATPYSVSQGYDLQATSASVNPSNSHGRAAGRPVRCIRLFHALPY